MKITSVLMEVAGWEELAGWLNMNDGIVSINSYCKSEPAHCCRRKLVQLYCERTAKSPYQVAEDFARALEDGMKNKKVANKLRKLQYCEFSTCTLCLCL